MGAPVELMDAPAALDREVVACRACPRLVAYAAEVRDTRRKPGYGPDDYWCRPVPSFGSPKATLLIVGLAPGTHGAGRTGRPFTGDEAGVLLYRTLHALGLASAPEAVACDDGLELDGVRITNALRCAPPQNRPTAAELRACRGFLVRELALMPGLRTVLALGTVAHRAVVACAHARQAAHRFAHGARHRLPGVRWELVDSYHPSGYNVKTRRLTAGMFAAVLRAAVEGR